MGKKDKGKWYRMTGIGDLLVLVRVVAFPFVVELREVDLEAGHVCCITVGVEPDAVWLFAVNNNT